MKENAHRDSTSVLVIDDEQAISKLIRFNLEDESTQVIDAATGYDGIRILQESNIDLLLLDLGLPDIDGRTVLSKLRATDLLCDLPVIVISAEPPDRRLVEQFRLDDYIQKPFDMRDFLSRVKRVISIRDHVHCSV